MNSIPKTKTIGILGGGQLGRMLAMAAGRLGFYTIVLDPEPDCPAVQFANSQIVAAYEDENALQVLASKCQTITYEFENVSVENLHAIASHCQVFPPPDALEVSQDRITEKKFLKSIGLQCTTNRKVSTRDQLLEAINVVGLPAILKTRRLGYDGKGQIRLDGDSLNQNTDQIDVLLKTACILEKTVDFQCEISVIAARTPTGETACYDPAINTHQNGILIKSRVPCGLPEEIIRIAKSEAAKLMNQLDYVGVIGVEFFVTNSGELLINEFAPRVHNSGHWTEATCLVSQFEQHIRAISGLPLGTTKRHFDGEMTNLLGVQIDDIFDYAKQPGIFVHDYGKEETRQGRKMGHVTKIKPLTKN